MSQTAFSSKMYSPLLSQIKRKKLYNRKLNHKNDKTALKHILQYHNLTNDTQRGDGNDMGCDSKRDDDENAQKKRDKERKSL